MLEKSYLANGGTTLPFVMLRAVHGTENTIFWCWTVTPKEKVKLRVVLSSILYNAKWEHNLIKIILPNMCIL